MKFMYHTVVRFELQNNFRDVFELVSSNCAMTFMFKQSTTKSHISILNKKWRYTLATKVKRKLAHLEPTSSWSTSSDVFNSLTTDSIHLLEKDAFWYIVNYKKILLETCISIDTRNWVCLINTEVRFIVVLPSIPKIIYYLMKI